MPQDNASKEPSDMPSPENSKGDQIERMMAELERLEKPGAIKAGNSQFWLERDNQDSLEKKATD